MVNINKTKTSKDIFDNSRPNIKDLSSITDNYMSNKILKRYGKVKIFNYIQNYKKIKN